MLPCALFRLRAVGLVVSAYLQRLEVVEEVCQARATRQREYAMAMAELDRVFKEVSRGV